MEDDVFIGAKMLTIPEVINILQETKCEINMKEFCASMEALQHLIDIDFDIFIDLVE